MNVLEKKFRAKIEAGGKILLPYLTGLYPDRETFVKLLFAVEKAGADGLEVGIPFSDPSADGPVLQEASARALKGGATVRGIMEAVAEAREKGFSLPLVYMTYFNPVLAFGPEAFAVAARESGADALITVDLPPEEAGELVPHARKAGLASVMLVAPTTGADRIPAILENASGFVYCVAVTGVTGVKKPTAATIAEIAGRLRPHTDLPVLAGFGINDAPSAAALAAHADGVIVGSALTTAIGNLSGDEAARAAIEFLSPLRAAIDAV